MEDVTLTRPNSCSAGPNCLTKLTRHVWDGIELQLYTVGLIHKYLFLSFKFDQCDLRLASPPGVPGAGVSWWCAQLTTFARNDPTRARAVQRLWNQSPPWQATSLWPGNVAIRHSTSPPRSPQPRHELWHHTRPTRQNPRRRTII